MEQEFYTLKGYQRFDTGGLTASSGGITAAMVFGLLAALIFRPKDKNG